MAFIIYDGLKGNNKHLPGEQNFTIRFSSRIDADKALLKILANSESVLLEYRQGE